MYYLYAARVLLGKTIENDIENRNQNQNDIEKYLRLGFVGGGLFVMLPLFLSEIANDR